MAVVVIKRVISRFKYFFGCLPYRQRHLDLAVSMVFEQRGQWLGLLIRLIQFSRRRGQQLFFVVLSGRVGLLDVHKLYALFLDDFEASL